MDSSDENRVTFEPTGSLMVARLTCREISSLDAIDQLLNAFKRKIDSIGGGNLLIDFSEVHFVATSAINMLLIILKRMRIKGGDVYLCGICEPIYQVFTLMQIHKLFEIFPTRDEAIQAVAKR